MSRQRRWPASLDPPMQSRFMRRGRAWHPNVVVLMHPNRAFNDDPGSHASPPSIRTHLSRLMKRAGADVHVPLEQSLLELRAVLYSTESARGRAWYAVLASPWAVVCWCDAGLIVPVGEGGVSSSPMGMAVAGHPPPQSTPMLNTQYYTHQHRGCQRRVHHKVPLHAGDGANGRSGGAHGDGLASHDHKNIHLPLFNEISPL